MINNPSIFQKINSALVYLKSETDKKISQIMDGENGSDIINNLNLVEYCNYYEETMKYFKTPSVQFKCDKELNKQLFEITKIEIKKYVKNSYSSFLGFNLNFLRDDFGFERNLTEKILFDLRQISSKIENILYWMSIQE